MLGHRLGDALAARKARADELAGIALVDGRAGGADGFAAVPARDVQRIVDADGLGEAVGGGDFDIGPGLEDLGCLPGGQIDGIDLAVEADGVGASASGGDLAFEVAEFREGDHVVGGPHRPRAMIWFGGDGGGRAVWVTVLPP